MPALEALQDRLRAAHTLACGISVDSTFCHAAWGEQLGGISFPLVSDRHPQGELASLFGVYLADKALTDRATVIIDAEGIVRFVESVTPAGKRDMAALVARCEELDRGRTLPAFEPPPGLPQGATLYIKDRCMFSRWALSTRANLHLDHEGEGGLPVRNVSRDAAALAELERLGGKPQAPALIMPSMGDQVMYESADIAKFLVGCAAWR